MDISMDLLEWFIDFLIKKTSGSCMKNISNKELAEENLIKENYTHLYR